MIADRRLVDWLLRTAEQEGIPHQVKQPNIGGTDAGAIHLEREGVPVSAISTPCRYIHSPESVLDLTDMQNALRLAAAALRRLPGDWPRAV
jgi:endoglucanase